MIEDLEERVERLEKKLIINKEIASTLKSATVGIGLRQEGIANPVLISGTGFFIDPDGFIITATHVIDRLEEIAKNQNQQNKNKLKIAAFIVRNEGGKVQIITKNLPIRAKMTPIISGKYFGPKNYDLSMVRIEGKGLDLPHLVIKKPSKLELYKDILMCGYPGGGTTLNVTDTNRAMKTHPIIQKGMISSIMPADHAASPTGIITDIIGTGGSSGSPIVDAEDGELISVAQNVVGTGVNIPLKNQMKNVDLLGTAKIGIVFGVANYFLEPLVTATLSIIKPLIDENGMPKEGVTDRIIQQDTDEKGNLVISKENKGPKIDMLE